MLKPILNQAFSSLWGIGLLYAATQIKADSIKPVHFGPFFVNEVGLNLSPIGYDDILSTGLYHFQIGWIEPLGESSKGIFSETYFETNGNFNLSPFTSDIGATFNLKPIRYLEVGLSYNRLIFHNSLIAFKDSNVSLNQWRPGSILPLDDRAGGGADIFTYQANLTYNLNRVQFYLFGSRALWDIDATGRTFVYEYGSDILIQPRDRINNFLGQISFNLRPHSIYKKITYSGFVLRNEYWFSDHTELHKNLVSVGITGFRLGVNSERQRRGLDFSIGYWTQNPQLKDEDWSKQIMLLADWRWNIQFLKI